MYQPTEARDRIKNPTPAPRPGQPGGKTTPSRSRGTPPQTHWSTQYTTNTHTNHHTHTSNTSHTLTPTTTHTPEAPRSGQPGGKTTPSRSRGTPPQTHHSHHTHSPLTPHSHQPPQTHTPTHHTHSHQHTTPHSHQHTTHPPHTTPHPHPKHHTHLMLNTHNNTTRKMQSHDISRDDVSIVPMLCLFVQNLVKTQSNAICVVKRFGFQRCACAFVLKQAVLTAVCFSLRLESRKRNERNVER